LYYNETDTKTYIWSDGTYEQVNAAIETVRPVTGETNKLYFDDATKLLYVWNGLDYEAINENSEIPQEVFDLEELPETGEVNKLYTVNENLYKWNGTEFELLNEK